MNMEETISSLPPLGIYAAIGAMAFGEPIFLVGFLLPGEIAVILGGVMASKGLVSLPLMIAVVVTGAVGGDFVGFQIGRLAGARILRSAIAQKHAKAVAQVHELIERRGAIAVIVGRATSYLRPIVPLVAGAANMSPRRFLAANLAGGIAWGTAFTLAGYALGDAYGALERQARWLGIALGTLLVAAAAVVWVRRARNSKREA